MPKLIVKLKKESWLLGNVEGELHIEADTVEDLFKIAKERPKFEVK